MYKLFTWCTSLSQKISDDNGTEHLHDFYERYFTKTNVCSTIFFLGIAIAAVIALLYYFGICNHVFKLAKRWSWLCALVVVFGVTLSVTIPTIVGHYDKIDANKSTGIFGSANNTTDYLKEEVYKGADDETMNMIDDVADIFRNQFLPKGETNVTRDNLPWKMGIANGCYAMVVFIGLSFAFKRHTKHGSSIPL
ncbi:MAG: hypothetical protein IJP44_10570 [Bacteroidales bacterium]|nr:hypothetical protein [Bacteroidales bacterium]